MPASRPDQLSIGSLLALVRREAGRDFDKAAVLQTIGTLSEALSVALLVPLLHVMANGSRPLDIPLLGLTFTPTLPLVLVAFVVLVLIRCLALERKERFNARVTFGFAERMSSRLFSALAATRWSVVSTWRTADMSFLVTGDSDRLVHTLNLLLSFIQSIAMVAIFAALSFFLSPTMTFVAGFVGVVMLATTSRVRNRAAADGRKLIDARQAQFRITDEFFNGLRTAKAFELERRHVAAMDEMLEKVRDRNIGFVISRARSATIYQVCSALALAGFAWAALELAHLGLPTLIAMIFLYMRLAPKIMTIHSSLQELKAQVGGVEKLLAMLAEAESNAEDIPSAEAPPLRLKDEISIAEVGYHYPAASRPALEGLRATIRAGQITALVGPTGSGKSTLVDILMGFDVPGSGEIIVDGTCLSPALARRWQQSIAYVPQETFLFNATIAENLRMASADATDSELWQALATADAAKFVGALPGQLEHRIGDRGRGLSGGERQRIAIARALLRKPDLLILDEATSALDALSQRRVAQALSAMRGSLTILVVAHRPAMVAFADHIIVLDGGKLAASGTPEAILAGSPGHFSESIDAEQGLAYSAR